MSQMNKTLRPLRVATTRDSHLIITILCWQAIALHLHLKERLLLSRKWAGQYLTPDSASSTTSNQEHSDVLMPDQAWIALKREVTRPTVESHEPILPSAGTNLSTILPLSAITSRDNSICFPLINWRLNELGQQGLSTPEAEISSSL